MRRMDELHLIIRSLAAGCSRFACVRRHQDRTPARRDVDEALAIEAIYRKPNTSKPMPGTRLSVSPAQSACESQIRLGNGYTYVPMAHGFVYLVAVIDCSAAGFSAIAYRSHGSRVLHRGVQEALAKHAAGIFNSIRAANSPAPISPACFLKTAIAISMTAKARGVQCLYRAAMAVGQMGRGVSQSLRHGIRGSHFDRFLSKFL